MANWRGLAFGAVPWVWVTGSAISWAYAVASATGAQGIVAGYGANLRTMFVWGMIAALISVLLTILYFWFTVVVLGLDFYIMPPVERPCFPPCPACSLASGPGMAADIRQGGRAALPIPRRGTPHLPPPLRGCRTERQSRTCIDSRDIPRQFYG